MVDIKDMDLQEYCGLNRPRFRFDPESDAAWYFGNQEVSAELRGRVSSDFVVRGVPKCGVIGRFGQGKTHTLFHLKHLLETDPASYPAKPVVLRIAPYDEDTKGLGGWSYIHGKMLDAMGERFLREMVRAFDQLPHERTRALDDVLADVFRFGSENLQNSLAAILSAYFLREGRATMPAWDWLRGQKPSGKELSECGVTVWLEHAGDMIDVILNLGALCRRTYGLGLCFLMDECQALNDVEKRATEIHDTFLQMAEPDNEDVGFVLALFGTGQGAVPPVVSDPPDILSRLGVTSVNIHEAFIDLRRIINSEEDVREFMLEFLRHIRAPEKAAGVVEEFGLAGRSSAELLPFEPAAIDLIARILFQSEPSRNPRMIIMSLARVVAAAYQRAKVQGAYVVADAQLVADELSALS
jgi:hypothetical protein